ncbi:MAG: hypothetical protein H6710_16595 [Myxococcales bacterium]|nr:hypothetical protein [Myxococcales bacterium]MCB9706545.1 hypothetical protein [Myxococcales bacterium]
MSLLCAATHFEAALINVDHRCSELWAHYDHIVATCGEPCLRALAAADAPGARAYGYLGLLRVASLSAAERARLDGDDEALTVVRFDLRETMTVRTLVAAASARADAPPPPECALAALDTRAEAERAWIRELEAQAEREQAER